MFNVYDASLQAEVRMSLTEYGTVSDPFKAADQAVKDSFEAAGVPLPAASRYFVAGDPRYDPDARNGDPYAGPARFGTDINGEVHRLKYWEPDTYDHQHMLICRLSISMSNKAIASALGITETWVSVILNDPRAAPIRDLALRDVADNISDVQGIIAAAAPEAARLVIQQIRNPMEKSEIRQRAAFGLLDRAGYSKVERRQVSGMEISPELAERMEQTLSESNELATVSYEVPTDVQ
jgi:predicted transcriptional regulator